MGLLQWTIALLPFLLYVRINRSYLWIRMYFFQLWKLSMNAFIIWNIAILVNLLKLYLTIVLFIASNELENFQIWHITILLQLSPPLLLITV